MNRNKYEAMPLSLLIGLLLAGCGGGLSDSTSDSSGGDSSTNCSKYVDLVPASEIQAVNACGTQVALHYQNAEQQRRSALASCQQGDISSADIYYDNYNTALNIARATYENLCQDTGTSLPDPTPVTTYNLCTQTVMIGDQTMTQVACYGPVQQYDKSCGGSYLYHSSYPSLNACSTAINKLANGTL